LVKKLFVKKFYVLIESVPFSEPALVCCIGGKRSSFGSWLATRKPFS